MIAGTFASRWWGRGGRWWGNRGAVVGVERRGTSGGDECRERSEYEDGGMLLSGRAERQSGSRRTGVSLVLALSFPLSLSLSLFLSLSFSLSLFGSLSFFVSFDHSSLSLAPRGEAEKERPDGGVRAGLLRGETLPRRSVVSDQTAGQCEPSWAVSSSNHSSSAVVPSRTRSSDRHLGKVGVQFLEMDLSDDPLIDHRGLDGGTSFQGAERRGRGIHERERERKGIE